MSTATAFNIECLEEEETSAIVNLRRINDIRFVNQFQALINGKLPEGGYYIGVLESHEQRRRRIFRKYIPGFAQLYYCFDYVFKRVFPRLPVFRLMYFLLTMGRNRVLSKAEALGRLVAAGFKIVEVREIGRNTFFVGKKVAQPCCEVKPSYGPLFVMNRIGKDGEMIRVFKFRTMYPYAEYLQEYVYEQNKLAEGGKFANDFRITPLGRFMRRMWLDELPMLINLIRGDIKIVGVRPLSKHYYSLYTQELQEKRIDSKPGLLPPFYFDMPRTLEEIIESELRYLNAYQKQPVATDVRYFLSICSNILLKRARSN
jgi:lipopolysaccharide/colanic/teichoic acid biosynthesis glycosyltransferase